VQEALTRKLSLQNFQPFSQLRQIRQAKIGSELLFAFYEQELQATIDQLKEYPKPHLLPAIMEMIQPRRNQKAIADHVRRGIRGGINTFVNSPCARLRARG
jgi:hypothetical protein